MTAAQERAQRRRELLRELEELRRLRDRLAARKVRRLQLERVHARTRLSC